MPFYHPFISYLINMCRANNYNKLQDEVIYSILTNNKKELIGYQLNVMADGIRIRFPSRNNPMNYIYVIANIPKMLNKQVIEESDLYIFKEKYYEVIYNRLFNYDSFLQTEVLNRMDYKYDYMCRGKKEKENLLVLASKARNSRYSAQKQVYAVEEGAISIYYNSRNYRINLYDKFEESGYSPVYENILRYELQIMSGMMNKYLKKYGLIRDIDNYWNMRDFFFKEYLLPVLYSGDFYKNNIISRMLNKSKNKPILVEKLKLVQNSDSIEGIYTYSQIKQLQRLNINPLQNNSNLENPMKYLKEVC
jgi:hypothetical protein